MISKQVHKELDFIKNILVFNDNQITGLLLTSSVRPLASFMVSLLFKSAFCFLFPAFNLKCFPPCFLLKAEPKVVCFKTHP